MAAPGAHGAVPWSAGGPDLTDTTPAPSGIVGAPAMPYWDIIHPDETAPRPYITSSCCIFGADHSLLPTTHAPEEVCYLVTVEFIYAYVNSLSRADSPLGHTAAEALIPRLALLIQGTATAGYVALGQLKNRPEIPNISVVVMVPSSRAKRCIRDMKLLVQETDPKLRCDVFRPEAQSAHVTYNLLVEYVDIEPHERCVALHKAKQERAQRRWTAVRQLTKVAGVMLQLFTHAHYSPRGEGAKLARRHFEALADLCTKNLALHLHL